MDLESLVAEVDVGSTLTISPGKLQISIEDFQPVAREVERLAFDGVLVVIKTHRESSSGRNLIDLILAEKIGEID